MANEKWRAGRRCVIARRNFATGKKCDRALGMCGLSEHALRALVDFGHDWFPVPQRFGAGQAAVARAQHDFNQLIAGLVERQFAENSRNVHIDVPPSASVVRILLGEFDDRLNRIAYYVAVGLEKGAPLKLPLVGSVTNFLRLRWRRSIQRAEAKSWKELPLVSRHQ